MTSEACIITSVVTFGINRIEDENKKGESNLVCRIMELNFDNLLLLCELFYLPFEHGTRGLQLLQDFHWLKSNAYNLVDFKSERDSMTTEISEWSLRAKRVHDLSSAVHSLLEHIIVCKNKELVYDLYTYIWDMNGVVSLLDSYVKWLGFSKGWKETFSSGEQEPWVFRGGLIADLQRLIPVDSGNDLFTYKSPDVPDAELYSIKPYCSDIEKQSIYNLCRQLYNINNIPDDLLGDRYIGPYLAINPEFAMFAQSDSELIGFACASKNYEDFRSKLKLSWIPSMCSKYPLENAMTDEYAQLVQYFYNFEEENCSYLKLYPSSITCKILPTVTDVSVTKRLLTCLLAALRANGSFGVHIVIENNDQQSEDFYKKLGFAEVTTSNENSNGRLIMGRIF